MQYSFRVIEVNQQAGAMVIEYSAAGKPTINVGARIPVVGETLEQVVVQFAPIYQWNPPAPPQYQAVEVGEFGEIEYNEPVFEPIDVGQLLVDQEAQTLAAAEAQAESVRAIIMQVLSEQGLVSSTN